MSIRRSALPAESTVTLREIRDGVRGRSSPISRAAAIELLAQSDFPNKHRDLQKVLEDDTTSPRVRYLAALALPRTDPGAAEEILVRAARALDPLVLTGVMRALGQVGGPEAIAAIERALPHAKGTALKQAHFARLLIAHRSGLQGRLEDPPAEGLLELPNEAGHRVLVRAALSEDAERCLVSLGPRPYGIELAEDAMYEWRCNRCRGMVALNRDFTAADALSRLATRRALFAIGTVRDTAEATESSAALLLTSPGGKPQLVRISVYLTNGDRLFVGEGDIKGEVGSWTLRAVRRLGGFPIRAEGIFRGGRLQIRAAASGTRVVQKARPQPLGPTASQR